MGVTLPGRVRLGIFEADLRPHRHRTVPAAPVLPEGGANFSPKWQRTCFRVADDAPNTDSGVDVSVCRDTSGTAPPRRQTALITAGFFPSACMSPPLKGGWVNGWIEWRARAIDYEYVYGRRMQFKESCSAIER